MYLILICSRDQTGNNTRIKFDYKIMLMQEVFRMFLTCEPVSLSSSLRSVVNGTGP